MYFVDTAHSILHQLVNCEQSNIEFANSS